MVLTASIFITKMLGLIYVFPFKAIVGAQGLALYQYGYAPYTLILSLATLGIPLAVSKFVSKYNALGDYRTGQRLFRSGLIVMSVTGLIAFFILFLLANPIAHRVIDPDQLDGNTIEDVVFTIRMVSVALLVVPIMSLIRGYFQGFGSMGPTAVSQVIEQIIRIIFILILTFLIIDVWGGGLGTAVGFATFGAFVGGVGGLAVLLVYWKKRQAGLHKQVVESTIDHQIPLPKMYKELLRYALPISFVGLAIPLYQNIDLLTFNGALMQSGMQQEIAETYFGVFSQASHKLILIPVSIATAMSLTILPTVTKSFTNNDTSLLQRQITQTYQIILFLTVPAAAGLLLLSDSAYGALFGVGDDFYIGSEMLSYYAPVAVLFSIFAVTASLLQGINRQKYAVIALIAGIVFKLATNYWFIVWFGPGGAVLSTAIGYILSVSINVWAIGKFAQYDYTYLLKRILLVFLFTVTMGIAVVIMNAGLQLWFPLTTRLNAFIVLIPTVLSGVIVYMYMSIRSGLAGQILGHRFKVLNK